VHLRAARRAASELDLLAASDAERKAFHRQQEAARLVSEGWTLIEPGGRKVLPRDRSAMPVGEDD